MAAGDFFSILLEFPASFSVIQSVRMLLRSPMPMRYFNYAGLSPTRVEAVEEMQAVSNEFRTRLFSESGIAWYRKQVENYRQKVARLLRVNLGEGGDTLAFVPNATTGYRLTLSELDLHRGDVVITSDQEHPSTSQ